MASYTKAQKQAEEQIKAKIVDAHKRGICNRDGKSDTGKDGILRPAGRNIGRVTFHKVYPRYA